MAISGMLAALGLGLPSTAGDMLDKGCEVIFNVKGKEVLEDVQARLQAYTGAVPPNHDIERAIRLAEITVTLFLIRLYRQEVEAESFDTRGAQLSPFIDKAAKWARDEIGLGLSMKLKSNDALVSEINASLDRVLPEDRPSIIENALAGARDQVWAALNANAGQAPPQFEALFYGRKAGMPGWSLLFLAFIREALKTNPRAEVAFVTTRLAAVRETLRNFEATLRSIKDDTTLIRYDTSTLRSDVAELLILAKRGGSVWRHAEKTPMDSISSIKEIKYFGTKERDIIRSKLSNYRQEHRIDLGELARRINDCIMPNYEFAYFTKTLKRFLRGYRVDDSFVGELTVFTDPLPYPSVPELAEANRFIQMLVDPRRESMKIELAINDRAEVIIFHSAPFVGTLLRVDFYIDTSDLKFVFNLNGFEIKMPYGILIRQEFAPYMRRANRVLMVHMDEETGKPIQGGYLPFRVLQTANLSLEAQ
ncbi:MAG: hypothetical protein WC806_02925 [Candidatus Gracilibacteria bacterium]|jgi:hypothetical protein